MLKKIIAGAGILLLCLVLLRVFTGQRPTPHAADDAVVTPPASKPISGTVVTGLTSHTLTTGGRTRTYTVYVPSVYDAEYSYPLVLLFHGGNGTGMALGALGDTQDSIDRMLEGTGFMQKADAEKFIVVAPAGVDGNWNDGRGTSEPELQGVDDVAFIHELLDVLESNYSLDTKRIYATGISNGGMFSYRLACEMGNRIAAVGGVSSAIAIPVAEQCTTATPIVGIQGTDDPLLPFDGTPTKKFARAMGTDGSSHILSAADTMALWAKNNSCATTPTTAALPVLENDGTTVTKYSYSNCTTPRAVEYYVVTGMGHGWPPNTRAALEMITGPTSHNINATDVVWEFFSAHSNTQ